MGLTHKLMDDFKFNTTIMQHVINMVEGNVDDEFEEQGKILWLFICMMVKMSIFCHLLL